MHVPRTLRPRLLAFSVKGGPLAMVAVALVASAAWPRAATAQATGTAKTFFDYIQPTPIVCSPLTSNTWGTTGPCPSDDSPAYVTPGCDVLPRDTCNGMEAPLGAGQYPEYYYWDGKVIQDTKTGLWHLFADRWDNSGGFNAWVTSQPHHASGGSSLFGKFTDTGVAYTNGPSGSTGHNSSVFPLNDGTYGLVASEVIPFTVWTATSLDGPWTKCANPSGELFADPDNIGNCNDGHSDSNVSIVARTDNKFEAIQRHGRIAIADSVCGPYNFVKPTNTYPSNQQPSSSCQGSIYPNRQTHTDPLAGQKGGPPQNIGSCNTYGCAEDPTIWYSGGMYHVLYDYPEPDKVGYHLYSSDGMKWSDGGFAYDPRLAPQIFGLVGSTTVNQWYKMERPAVALENGHVVAVTWAVSDVNKNNGGSGQELGPGTNHGSKVVMAAFDGASMDCDLNPAACTSADGGATGGASGSADAGQAGAGGSVGGGGSTSGGQTGSGGASGGSGGASSRGGSSGSGGGAVAAGGSSASGGVASGGHGSGGQVAGSGGSGNGGSAAGGARTSSGSGGSSSGGSTGPASSSSSGCSCTIQGNQRASMSGSLLLLGLVLATRRRRRPSGASSPESMG